MDFLFDTLNYIIPFLFVITVLVFVHELGHYLVARYYDVEVEVFSIGFGKEIFGWTDSQGTRWKISLIPLGGYVKFLGDADASSVLPDKKVMDSLSKDEVRKTLHHATVWQRIAISFAGPFANYLFAFIILTGMFAFVGLHLTSAKVTNLVVDKPAVAAGIKVGDVITHVNDSRIMRMQELQTEIMNSNGKPLNLKVDRRGETLDITVTPVEKHLGIEIAPNYGSYVKLGVLESAKTSVSQIYFLTSQSLTAFGQMLTGKRGADQLSGVIGIAHMTGKVAKAGFEQLISLMALISVALGLINLFPIPMLDGGHILFYLVEAVKGSPVNEKAQEIAFRIGFAIVLALMLIATWSDISRLGILTSFKAWFS